MDGDPDRQHQVHDVDGQYEPSGGFIDPELASHGAPFFEKEPQTDATSALEGQMSYIRPIWDYRVFCKYAEAHERLSLRPQS